MNSNDKLSPKRSVGVRKENSRDERSVVGDYDKKIVFSFKDFDDSQGAGQSYCDWQKEKLLSEMLKHFEEICKWSIVEAISNNKLSIYSKFPLNTDFKKPKHIADDVKWAAIKDVKGQKHRVIGHVMDNVFYVVFLDKDHRFWLTKKKHT